MQMHPVRSTSYPRPRELSYAMSDRPPPNIKARRVCCISFSSALFLAATLANAALLIVGIYLNNWLLEGLPGNPFVGLTAAGLVRIGATSTDKIVNSYQYWRLLSSMFVNAGVIQLWANCGTMWTLGGFLLGTLRTWQVVLVYMLSGIGGVLAAANLASNYITAGASGPAFGFLGASFVLLVVHHSTFRMHWLTWGLLLTMLGLNTFMGAMPFVANACNVAAFITGACTCLAFLLVRYKTLESDRAECLLRLGAVLASAAVAALLVLGFVGLNTGLPAAGAFQHTLGCVPSSLWDCEAARVYSKDCSFLQFLNGTVVMTCPRGVVYTLPNLNISTPTLSSQACLTYCGSAPPPR